MATVNDTEYLVAPPKLDKMPEAEVSLRLAMALIDSEKTVTTVEVAIDGAQVKTGKAVHFEVQRFLANHGYRPTEGAEGWRGDYKKLAGTLRVHSSSGRGDVTATLVNGQKVRAECKKGPLKRSKNSVEYRLIREALGQLLTITELDDSDLLVVAVPHSSKFSELAERWNAAPLVQRARIRIVTVSRDGDRDDLRDLLENVRRD